MKMIFLTNIGENSFIPSEKIENTFSAFKSLNDIFYLIYATQKLSIVSYNIENKTKINEIKNAHNNYITNIRHYLDKMNKRDLIISLSLKNNDVKIWNLNNFECLISIKENNYCNIYSGYILNYNFQNYIIIGVDNKIKTFYFNGKVFKNINLNESIYFIDIYNDDKINNNIYILTGNSNSVNSYDYKNNKLYNKYYDKEIKIAPHISILVNEYEGNTELVESCLDGYIRIWNFYSGLLLKKIFLDSFLNSYKGNVFCSGLFGLCLMNNNYLFVACQDKAIKVID